MGLDGVVPGTAYTLITPKDGAFAVDLVQNLRLSSQPVPPGASTSLYLVHIHNHIYIYIHMLTIASFCPLSPTPTPLTDPSHLRTHLSRISVTSLITWLCTISFAKSR